MHHRQYFFTTFQDDFYNSALIKPQNNTIFLGFEYEYMQVGKYVSLHLPKYTSMQVRKYTSMQL